ncbi:MAG: alkaline phosphatase D family protein [Microcoleaceae cyanobacterium]
MLGAEDLFNETFYLANNPDVRVAVESGAISSGFAHFLESGQFQVRQPSALYNEAEYLAENPDVVQFIAQGFVVSGFQHFVEVGQFELRDPSLLFDTGFYLTENPGVADAVRRGELTPIDHFVNFGQFEDRAPSALFNEAFYLTQNPTAREAVEQDDELTGIRHYLDVGAAQNLEYSPFIELRGSTLPNRIAVGDVTQTSAVLLTRSTSLGEVIFEFGLDPQFNTILGLETAIADPITPAKVQIEGLIPGTQYFYRVTDSAETVEVGSFRTPESLGTQSGLRFGAGGSSQGELAPYPAITNAPNRNLDFFVQLGDLIQADTVSPDLPDVEQAVSLTEFQTKHNEVNSERVFLNNWATLSASTPIYATWDDGEVATGTAGGFQVPELENQFANQTPVFLNGLDAFQSYRPLRDEFYGETVDPRTANRQQLYRSTVHGSDAASFVLDVRSFRDPALAIPEDLSNSVEVTEFLQATFTPDRTLLGDAQLETLKAELLGAEGAGITWKFIFSPVPIQNLGLFDAADRWEGYSAERTELLQFIDQNQIDNVVFVSGSLQGSIVNNLTYQTGFDQPQIPTSAIEVTIPAVASQIELSGEFVAAPFGVEFFNLTPDELVSEDIKDAYDDLETQRQRDRFTAEVLDQQLTAQGYDPIGLEDSTVTADLAEGSYIAAHNFGWLEFVIDETTQQLQVTTYGIEPYTQTDVETIPANVIGRIPEMINQFVVSPQ